MIVGGALLFIFHGLFVSDAYGYIDPGTGSIIIQAIVGALVDIGITLKDLLTKMINENRI